jgi:hypothetical protein
LRAARQAADLSLEDATFEVRAVMGRKVTRKTLERYELHPTPEDRADERLVIGLCAVYRVDPHTISVPIAERAERMAALLLPSNRRGGDSGSTVTAGYPHTVEVAA